MHNFFGPPLQMNKMVRKAWPPPKIKFFALLSIQNSIWTADRLAKRSWNNCGFYPANTRNSGTSLCSSSLHQEALGDGQGLG
jgi:hypothetical protein